MQIGPVQIIVIGFPGAESLNDLGAELAALRSAPGIAVLDVLSVSKDAEGRIAVVEVENVPSPDGGEDLALVTALTGLADGEPEPEPGDDDRTLPPEQLWYVDEAIPAGTSATIAVIEHRWAIGLRDHVREAGGALLADAWVHPSDLAAAGMVSTEQAERELLF